MQSFFAIFAAAVVAAAASTAPQPPASTDSTPINLPSCTTSQYDTLWSAALKSSNFNECADDLTVSPDTLRDLNLLAQVPHETLVQSSSCMLLFGDVARDASSERCTELQLVANGTWEMATAGLEIYRTPKVPTKYSKLGLSWAFAGLPFHTYFYNCLGEGGWSVFKKNNGIPPLSAITTMRVLPACETLFHNVQATIKKQPHEAIDQYGTDIHAFENITYAVAMDWMALLAAYKHESLVNLSVLTVGRQVSTIAIAALMVSAVLLALAAVIFTVQRTPPRHAILQERKRLLQLERVYGPCTEVPSHKSKIGQNALQ
ncbi:Aste57867_23777 [Aphanomyces stellatus]|uniref:Aste57867_23777 protein n=1 Tax=Aphanomyces stellatus TaxID=120398 RepID=A0A485LQ96_9STRA|nr:hypothetical protein As57867_023704 [Aphanomyces stellatus]VFU00422.1 Aste57867_23777 [Aphanomyces stellatus]